MITIARSQTLPLHVVRFSDAVTPDQLLAAYEAIAREPDWARADTFYIVEESARLNSEDAHELLDKLRVINRGIFEPLDLYVVRRVAWICYAPSAWPFVEYWLKDRHSQDGLHSEFCAGATLEVARQLFEEVEIEAADAQGNLQLLASFGDQIEGGSDCLFSANVRPDQ